MGRNVQRKGQPRPAGGRPGAERRMGQGQNLMMPTSWRNMKTRAMGAMNLMVME